MDLPVGLTGDVGVEEVPGVIFRVGSSEQQLTAGLCARVPEKETTGCISVGQSRRGSRPPNTKSFSNACLNTNVKLSRGADVNCQETRDSPKATKAIIDT